MPRRSPLSLILFLAIDACHSSAGSQTVVAQVAERPAGSAPPTIEPKATSLPAIVIDAEAANGPFSSVADLCAQLATNAPPSAACGPVATPPFAAEDPFLGIAAVALSEDSWFARIHPVVRTATGDWLVAASEEAANVASTDMATTIDVRLADAQVRDVVPGGRHELVLHLTVRGTIALWDATTKKFGPPTPSTASIETIVCGLGPTDILSCTRAIAGRVAQGSAVPPPPPRLGIDASGHIVALAVKDPNFVGDPRRAYRFP